MASSFTKVTKLLNRIVHPSSNTHHVLEVIVNCFHKKKEMTTWFEHFAMIPTKSTNIAKPRKIRNIHSRALEYFQLIFCSPFLVIFRCGISQGSIQPQCSVQVFFVHFES